MGSTWGGQLARDLELVILVGDEHLVGEMKGDYLRKRGEPKSC